MVYLSRCTLCFSRTRIFCVSHGLIGQAILLDSSNRPGYVLEAQDLMSIIGLKLPSPVGKGQLELERIFNFMQQHVLHSNKVLL